MNLILDIGNTRTKICLFDCECIVEKQTARNDCRAIIPILENIFERCGHVHSIMCSVAGNMTELSNLLKEKSHYFVELTSLTPIPIVNNYKTPSTLGLDRLAAAVGASVLFPDSNSLIIDAGTAITFDYLKAGREYAGGNIAPGIRLRFKALNDYTSRLPLVADIQECTDFGLDTLSAINNGVILGVLREIEGYVNDFKQKNVKAQIILTGGDSIFLSKKLKITIFAEPNLVTIGLNRILNYNVSKKY